MAKAAAPQAAGDRLMSLQEVCEVVPVHRMTIWRWSKAGKFPRPVMIGSRSLWSEREVSAWIQEHLNARPA